MIKLWNITTSNQDGRGLASFIGTMNFILTVQVHRVLDVVAFSKAVGHTLDGQ